MRSMWKASRRLVLLRFPLLLESWGSKIWLRVPRDSKTRIAVLARTSSNLRDRPTSQSELLALIFYWSQIRVLYTNKHQWLQKRASRRLCDRRERWGTVEVERSADVPGVGLTHRHRHRHPHGGLLISRWQATVITGLRTAPWIDSRDRHSN